MYRLALLLLAVALTPATPALADAEAGKAKAAVCAACHGGDGNSINPLWPNLAGQTSRYLYLQLKDFKEGRRKDPLMSPMAANLERQDMLDLADYFAAQKVLGSQYKADGAKVAQGKSIADNALCPMCHLGGFSGQNEIPRVAGQHYDYVVKQLRAFRARERTNDAGSMTAYTQGLTDEQIDALAQYITNLY
jgi:cytochrome c553